jgi:tetratricopeptide (TPR) repeat protein
LSEINTIDDIDVTSDKNFIHYMMSLCYRFLNQYTKAICHAKKAINYLSSEMLTSRQYVDDNWLIAFCYMQTDKRKAEHFYIQCEKCYNYFLTITTDAIEILKIQKCLADVNYNLARIRNDEILMINTINTYKNLHVDNEEMQEAYIDLFEIYLNKINESNNLIKMQVLLNKITDEVKREELRKIMLTQSVEVVLGIK